MNIFNVLSLFGGLAMFLFGMSVMGDGLEKSAGSKLKTILERLTSSPLKGFLLGVAVTAVIQSSSATTVMVVGFVNSGIMSLRQAIGIIMGANVGTTVTSWILSLSGIQGDSFFVQMLKPSSFSPVLAVIGIVLYMFVKSSKKKDIGSILLGFAVLMFGMETMSGAVEPLKDVPAFTNILLLFSNPVLGVLAGAALTAIIPIVVSFGWYPSGPVRNRADYLWQRHPHHPRPEHRYLRHRDAVVGWHQQKCPPHRNRTFIL